MSDKRKQRGEQERDRKKFMYNCALAHSSYSQRDHTSLTLLNQRLMNTLNVAGVSVRSSLSIFVFLMVLKWRRVFGLYSNYYYY